MPSTEPEKYASQGKRFSRFVRISDGLGSIQASDLEGFRGLGEDSIQTGTGFECLMQIQWVQNEIRTVKIN
ncbi:MAG: hypothetical protein SNJ55_04085 [Chloroherpetonaceae bacterium]